ncbi:substrate-binding domain-containing protein [Anaerocolumna sp. MB42-C2]|uniref:substrate-binding domain-containing protein n=1 Tax=Anaerocolumna sp. MB42-C2 TaxID=3070997 RepID=UPI0027E145D1|nr:substrate-binding domain-containing protein [Anaerocolumna sp. MB42-C2]WMJ89997.1 substrate-binding domain-containing protein [Anaerocolumna sp. MB42-C2]
MVKKYKILIITVLSLCILVPGIYKIVKNSLKTEVPINIIYIPKIIDDSNEFWSALIGGAEMAAKEFNINLKVVAPDAEEDYARQNQLIDWAIKQKPDAIALSPADYSETTAKAKEIADNNIKLVFIDSTVNENVQDALVATDNYLAGKKMGEYMKTFVNRNTKIAIVGHVKTASTAIEREKGLRSGLGSDESKIVDVVFCDSEFGKAYSLTIELLKEYPDLTMIAGLNEYSSVGAARAIKRLGLAGKVKVIGFDSSIEEIELLEEGVFQGIIIQKSFNMGYLGIEEAVKLVKGKKVEKNVDSGSQLITKNNMYTEENQKLLFPFWGE